MNVYCCFFIQPGLEEAQCADKGKSNMGKETTSLTSLPVTVKISHMAGWQACCVKGTRLHSVFFVKLCGVHLLSDGGSTL